MIALKAGTPEASPEPKQILADNPCNHDGRPTQKLELIADARENGENQCKRAKLQTRSVASFGRVRECVYVCVCVRRREARRG